MSLTVEEVKSFKVASNDLIDYVSSILKDIKDEEEHSNMKGLQLDYNNTSYAFIELKEDAVQGGGKYEYGGTTYQLVSFDTSVSSYPSYNAIVDRFNLTAYERWSRTGSYYNDYYYTYDKPTLSLLEIYTVPEQVIPAHEDFKYKVL